MINFCGGSEWRRWDLHIHSPESHLCNNFNCNFDEYVKNLFNKALEKDIYAIGITDYFTIEGYKKIKTEYLQNDAKLKELFDEDEEKVNSVKNILLIPNIEFRLNKLVGTSRINFHVLFSNDVSIKDIEENFLHEINFVYEGNPQDTDESRKLTIYNIKKLGEKLKSEHAGFIDSEIVIGMKNAVVDDSEIVRILKNKKSIFEGKYLLCVPSDEDLSEISWNGQDHQTRKVIIQKSDLLYASNPKTIKWGLGSYSECKEDFITEFKSIKPCIFGSDAHDFNTMFEHPDKRYCWIKADITFEGLKQLLYEPEERVRIQESNPSFEYNKPYFSKISIIEEFSIFNDEASQVYFKKNDSIKLNKGLIAVIGGRGSGKSILVNYIGNCFAKLDKTERDSFTHNENFKVVYCKNNAPESECEIYSSEAENVLDFIFISQGELKKRTNSKKLGHEIKKLLQLQDLSFDLRVQNEIDESNKKVVEIEKWFKREDESGNAINNREYNEEQKRYNEKLLESITTKENREKLDRYTTNIEILRNNETYMQKLIEIRELLISREKDINQLINDINGRYLITPINFGTQKDEINLYTDNLIKERTDIYQQNERIKDEFKSVFSGDLSTLLKNADSYKTKIAFSEQRLNEISTKEKELSECIADRNRLGDKIKSEYLRQANKIDESWNSIIDKFENQQHKELINQIFKDRSIEIKGEVVFNKKIFSDCLRGYLNLNCFKKTKDKTQEERIAEDFNILDINSFVSFIINNLEKYRTGEESVKVSGEIEKLFFGLKERSQYLFVEPTITYNGKPLNKLSVGQRGTVYLCMQLATFAFSQPLIFDQPEDDLDNEFITKELIDIIKKIKQFRQVIIVTHNANLVVNCDAEQVIVANNDNEKLSYISGSLENSTINDSVCKILEGGRKAFEKRRKRYNILK
mgnify:FL=1